MAENSNIATNSGDDSNRRNNSNNRNGDYRRRNNNRRNRPNYNQNRPVNSGANGTSNQNSTTQYIQFRIAPDIHRDVNRSYLSVLYRLHFLL